MGKRLWIADPRGYTILLPHLVDELHRVNPGPLSHKCCTNKYVLTPQEWIELATEFANISPSRALRR